MSKKSNGKKEIGILVGVIAVGIAIFVVAQVILGGLADGGFSKLVPTIEADKFFEMVDAKEDFVLIYGQASCSYCEAYKPVVAEVMKDGYEDVPVYYIDGDYLTETDKSSVTSYLDVTSTPTSYIFVGGSIVETSEGKKEVSTTKNFFDLYKTYVD